MFFQNIEYLMAFVQPRYMVMMWRPFSWQPVRISYRSRNRLGIDPAHQSGQLIDFNIFELVNTCHYATEQCQLFFPRMLMW